MAIEFQFEFPLANGLHARPASHFAQVAGEFVAAISLTNERTGRTANVRSVLALVGTDTRRGDGCRVKFTGSDEEAALRAMKSFVSEVLPGSDEALAPLGKEEDLPLPRSLKATGLANYLRGKAVCGGVGHGRVVLARGLVLPEKFREEIAGDSALEEKKAIEAIAAVSEAIRTRIEAATHSAEVDVLKAHGAIANDVALREKVIEFVVSQRRTAAQAVVAAGESFSEVLRAAESAYLRGRVLDVQDVCGQLVARLLGTDGAAAIKLTSASVCVADQMTPGQFLALDRCYLKGLVLGDGGSTSHTVILARSMNIPTLVGVRGAAAKLAAGVEVIVDGNNELLVAELSDSVRRYYAREIRTGRRFERQLRLAKASGTTADGHAVEIGANVASAEEVPMAIAGGADGIGLFRTEMLFMDRVAAPTEDQQVGIYSAAGAAARGRSVIIRLLDIGGDKPAPYLSLPREANPFLGYRGVRLYEEFSELIRTQLRAILRASGSGNLKILIPMVCCVEEVRAVKGMLAAAKEELGLDRVPPLGAMIEVPSAAFLMPELCAEVDFFSIGSNDLAQYFLAADRGNARVASLYTWSHPAFLRLLKRVVEGAHAQAKWIGLCGEMGDRDAALPLLVGLGLDEISVSVARVGKVKASIGTMRFDRCAAMFEAASRCGTRAEVEALARKSSGCDKNQPLLSADLVFRGDGATKEEVIKELADALYLAGRIERPQLIEEAVWRREEVYSTGFGGGFAIPHCKSANLSANSVVIARLWRPVEWGSLDGNPVDVVIFLAIREQEHAQEHMKVFSRLSRMVMRDEFRQQIRRENDPGRLVAFLRESLEMAAA